MQIGYTIYHFFIPLFLGLVLHLMLNLKYLHLYIYNIRADAIIAALSVHKLMSGKYTLTPSSSPSFKKFSLMYEFADTPSEQVLVFLF